MMKWPVFLCAALLAACAAAPLDRSGMAAVSAMRATPERMVVIAVANSIAPAMNSAGSTLRGYDILPSYVDGSDARATLDALARDYGLRRIALWPIPPLQLDCAVFELAPHAQRATLLNRLAHDPRVRLAQPVQTFGTFATPVPAASPSRPASSTPTLASLAAAHPGPADLVRIYNDPYIGLQRGFARIDAGGAQRWSQGEGVRVAVIDTGVDADHPDLRGRVVLRRDFVDDNMQRFEQDFHGTAVSGVIAAVANNHLGIAGVAPRARILALKACWQMPTPAAGAQCNSFTLAQALTVAIGSDAQVINLSLGGPADPLLTLLLRYALDHGIIVVGAVPSDGSLKGFPLDVHGVLAVAMRGPAAAAMAVLHAPGRTILTLSPGGHYDFVSGSSMAAASVSGAVALLLARDPHLGARTAYTLLSRSSTQGGENSVNVCKALAELLHQSAGCKVFSPDVPAAVMATPGTRLP